MRQCLWQIMLDYSYQVQLLEEKNNNLFRFFMKKFYKNIYVQPLLFLLAVVRPCFVLLHITTTLFSF
jgi:hypothetical protein